MDRYVTKEWESTKVVCCLGQWIWFINNLYLNFSWNQITLFCIFLFENWGAYEEIRRILRSEELLGFQVNQLKITFTFLWMLQIWSCNYTIETLSSSISNASFYNYARNWPPIIEIRRKPQKPCYAHKYAVTWRWSQNV